MNIYNKLVHVNITEIIGGDFFNTVNHTSEEKVIRIPNNGL